MPVKLNTRETVKLKFVNNCSYRVCANGWLKIFFLKLKGWASCLDVILVGGHFVWKLMLLWLLHDLRKSKRILKITDKEYMLYHPEIYKLGFEFIFFGKFWNNSNKSKYRRCTHCRTSRDISSCHSASLRILWSWSIEKGHWVWLFQIRKKTLKCVNFTSIKQSITSVSSHIASVKFSRAWWEYKFFFI